MTWSSELPRQVVEHIFLDTKCAAGLPVLSLKDRASCQAVCAAWNAYLRPRSLSLQQLSLVAGENPELSLEEACARAPAAWVVRVRPETHMLTIRLADAESRVKSPSTQEAYAALLAIWPRQALHELRLHMKPHLSLAFCKALPFLPNLQRLQLQGPHSVHHPLGSVLDSPILATLGSLQEVVLDKWGHVRLLGGQQFAFLPHLTRLQVTGSHHKVELDVALPSLQQLVLESPHTVLGAGGRLRLPQLMSLTLRGTSTASRKAVLVPQPQQAQQQQGQELQPLQGHQEDLQHGQEQQQGQEEQQQGSGGSIAELHVRSMPALRCLEVSGIGSLPPADAAGLSGLEHLSSLSVRCCGRPGERSGAVGLLQEAPASLRHLALSCMADDTAELGPCVAALTQLASLSLGRLQLLPFAGSLVRLKELELPSLTPAALAPEHLSVLSALKGLRMLSLSSSSGGIAGCDMVRDPAGESATQQGAPRNGASSCSPDDVTSMKALRLVLPRDCNITLGTRACFVSGSM